MNQVFLSYNSKNKNFVELIADRLKKAGFEPFLDLEMIIGGKKWVDVLEEGMATSEATLIFLGEDGVGFWQEKEVLNLIRLRMNNNHYKIIPVILPVKSDFSQERLPWFLADYQWIEFKETNDELAFEKLLEALGETTHETTTLGENPYRGLESFRVEDAHHFFGRTYDLNMVFHTKLRFNYSILNHNFLAIVANSGTGKSSFVQAGILASLKQGRFEGSENWKQIIFKPGNNPLFELSTSLKKAGLIDDSQRFEEKAIEDTRKLLRTIKEHKTNSTWVMYIDQFEEVIAQCKNETEREAFLENISNATKTEQLIILLSVRSDYYSAFAPYPAFKTLLEQHNFTLSTIDTLTNEDERTHSLLRDIIIKPAKNAGVSIEPDLVESLINGVKDVKGKLPMLQLALDLLWRSKKRLNEITLKDYASISQNRHIPGIIQTHADKVFNAVTKDGTDQRKAELFKKIFVPHLVEVSSNGEDVRRTALKTEILTINGYTQEEIEEIINELSSEKTRLLSVDETKVEVVHEVIIREWPLLKQWINERREAIIYRDRLLLDIEDYRKEKLGLYEGKQLDRAIEWQIGNSDLTSKSITKFIEEGIKKRKKTKGKIFIVVGVISGLILLLGLLYKPHKKIMFLNSIAADSALNRQIESAGGHIDSVKIFNIERNDYSIASQINYLKNLDSLFISNILSEDLNFLNANTSINFLSVNSNVSLRSLDGIEKLNNLQHLEISGNDNLISLSGIEKLSGLTYLSFYFNINLSNLRGIEKLSNLQHLEISYNENLSSLSEIEKLNGLQHLVISFNDSIISLRGIEKLSGLQYLEISNNANLNSLSGIEKLSGLKHLVIYDNAKLNSLIGVEKLSGLKHLEISGNVNLNCLNRTEKLSSLQHLKISNNDKLNSLRVIERLSSLQHLEISGNAKFSSLNGIEKLSSLQDLDIYSNQNLNSLSGINKLSSLQHLEIYNNVNLNSFSGIDKLIGLQHLEVTGNDNLSSLNGIEKLRGLQHLEISGKDKLSSLSGIAKLDNLQHLEISGNANLSSLSRIEKLSGLHYLGIYNNAKLNSLSWIENLRSLQHLEISGNDNLSSLNGIEKLRGLQHLYIYMNANLSSLSGIEKLSGLQHLDISSNANLSSLSGIENLRGLQHLNIFDNAKLNSLRGIEELTLLHYLEISYNDKLNSLSGIEKLKTLDNLTIKSHKDSIDINSIYQLEKLKRLTISENILIDYDLLSKKNPGVKLIRIKY